MLLHDNPTPLYYQLAEILKGQIERGEIPNGEKLLSESEMMEHYGIGRLTVRSALSQLVNMGYLKKMHGKGTFCCYMPPAPERMAVDVLLDIGDEYFSPYYLRSISQVLNHKNYNMLVSDTKDSSREICAHLNRIIENGGKGVILQPSHSASTMREELSDCFRRLQEARIPLVMIDSTYPSLTDASFLRLDEVKGGRIAAHYLLGLGHVDAALIYLDGYQDSMMRREGFLAEYREQGQREPRQYAFQQGGFEPVLRDLEAGLFSAIFCYNDDMAVNLMRLLKDRGLHVPDDVSVMGFDDSVLASATEPALTTISHPKQRLGELAANVLMDLIGGRLGSPFRQLFMPSLSIRASCAAK